MMNMEDLSRDDDFLSHLLVEKLGTGDVPLVVHKMDPSRRLPKTNAEDLLQIVRRVSKFFSPSCTTSRCSCIFSPLHSFRLMIQMVAMKGSPQVAIRQAVDDLLR